MQVGFTNEADILLLAPLHQKQVQLLQTPIASFVFVYFGSCVTQLGSKLMYAKFAGTAKATESP